MVSTGELCHKRTTKIGQPEVAYQVRYNRSSKAELSADDFVNGNYRVLAFFNRSKRT